MTFSLNAKHPPYRICPPIEKLDRGRGEQRLILFRQAGGSRLYNTAD
jgi:hypothetical protein